MRHKTLPGFFKVSLNVGRALLVLCNDTDEVLQAIVDKPSPTGSTTSPGTVVITSAGESMFCCSENRAWKEIYLSGVSVERYCDLAGEYTSTSSDTKKAEEIYKLVSCFFKNICSEDVLDRATGCRRVMGHGMYCTTGMLCDACVTEAKNQSKIDDLRAQLTESQEQLKFYKNQLSTKNKLCDSIEKQENVVKALLDLEIVHTPSTYLSTSKMAEKTGKILLLGKGLVAEVLRKLDVSEANITICSDGDIVLRIPQMGQRFVFREDAFGDIKLYDSFELYEEEYYEYDE